MNKMLNIYKQKDAPYLLIGRIILYPCPKSVP